MMMQTSKTIPPCVKIPCEWL